ncbi:MAG: hypothetical protein LBT45_01595 [Rickettsiales bacterium]|nr:hypothetical protein [Rickettsiales bacterium]
MIKTQEHYVIRNGKNIRYPSGCDLNCTDEHRLFNGRDCPHRIACMYENGDVKHFSRSEKGMIKTRERQLGDLGVRIVDDCLGWDGR